MTTNAVLVKKKGRRIAKILRPFPLGIIKFQKLSLKVRALMRAVFVLRSLQILDKITPAPCQIFSSLCEKIYKSKRVYSCSIIPSADLQEKTPLSQLLDVYNAFQETN